MDLRFARRPAPPPPPGILTHAALRAFLYGGRIGPHRDQILRFPVPEIARAVSDLSSEEAARVLAQMPAATPIAIATALDAATRTRLAGDCDDWRCSCRSSPCTSAAWRNGTSPRPSAGSEV
jgi:hypothetical protein